jgi:signal transduction histidine kinase
MNPLAFGLSIGVALVVPIIAFALFTRATIESDVSNRLHDDRVVTAQLAAAVVAQRIQADAASLTFFAARADVFAAARGRDPRAMDALLTGFVSPYGFKLAGLVDPSGAVFAREPEGLVDSSFAGDVLANAVGVSASQQGWMFMAPDGRAPTRTGTVAVMVAPVDVGSERWALYGLLDFTHYASAFAPVPVPSYRTLYLLDEASLIVASADAGGFSVAPTYGDIIESDRTPRRYSVAIPGLQRALTGGVGSETALVGGKELLAVHVVVVPGHWVLYLLDSPDIALAGARRLTQQVTVGAGAAAAIAAVLALVLAWLVGRLRRQRTELARLAISEERLRFARDLHDLLGRGLSLIAIKSELALRLVSGNVAASTEVGDIERVAREALRDVRAAVDGYRQPRLATELTGARSALAASGIECHVERQDGDLPDPIDSLFAWTVREGVTNVIRHSGAKRCEIRVSWSPLEARLEVTDDGVAEPPPSAGYGLLGVKERAAARGGVAEAGPIPGAGFRLRIAVPVGTTR